MSPVHILLQFGSDEDISYMAENVSNIRGHTLQDRPPGVQRSASWGCSKLQILPPHIPLFADLNLGEAWFSRGSVESALARGQRNDGM